MVTMTSKELFQEKFNTLPQEIKEAIVSVDTFEKLKKISQTYKLLIDKMGILGDETGLVMVGITHPKSYSSNLRNRLGVSGQVAEAITTEVNELIFKPIRASLQKIHGEYKEVEAKKEVYTAPENLPVGTAIEKPKVGTPTLTVNTPDLENTDDKIFKESGIEIEKPESLEKTTEETMLPTKSTILGLIENPETKNKESVSLPAGFSLGIQATPSRPLQNIGKQGAIHEEKLSSQFSSPATTITISPVVQKGDGESRSSDPYREPVSQTTT